MLKITKFKLFDLGRSGIEIEGQESIQFRKGYQIIDKVKRTRSIMLSVDTVRLIQEMKYYFFNCTGYWMDPFNRYYDIVNHKLLPDEKDENDKIRGGQLMLKNLWNKTEITGLSFREGGFVITASIEAIEGKKVIINTPFVTEEDDLSFYTAAMEKMGECVRSIIGFFTTPIAESVDPELLLTPEEREGLSVDELVNLTLEKMVDKNMIVLVRDEGPDALEESAGKKNTLNTNTKNIDGSNLPEGNADDDIPDADKAVTDNLAANTKQVFGASASEGEFPEGARESNRPVDVTGPLDELEHSKNMGIDNEDENVGKDESGWAE